MAVGKSISTIATSPDTYEIILRRYLVSEVKYRTMWKFDLSVGGEFEKMIQGLVYNQNIDYNGSIS